MPFSLAEIGLYLLILGFLLSAAYTIRRIIKKGNAGQRLLSWLSGILLAASLLAFFFMLGGGINYHRVSFAETAGISAEPCTAEDLSRICSWLTEEVNARSSQVSRDENGVMILSRPEGPDAAAAMESLGETFPDLSGSYPMPKKVLCSQILSRLGLTGIFSAFTIEANYNRDMTANREFWASYDGILEEISTQVNDTYLKINGQDSGVQSYDMMVELTVAYFKDKI
mgnify:CR=1 FL=1